MIIASLLNFFPLSDILRPEENRVWGAVEIKSKIKVAVSFGEFGNCILIKPLNHNIKTPDLQGQIKTYL